MYALILVGSAVGDSTPTALGEATCGPAVLTIDAQLCGIVGSQFVAELRMTGAPFEIVGGQYFLTYSQSTLKVLDVEAGDHPFFVLFASDIETPGSILVATTISPFGRGTSEDTVMARITFEIINRDSDIFIRFDPESDIRTTLTGLGDLPVFPLLRDAEVKKADLSGFADFQNCFSGSGNLATADCTCAFDRDTDGDVDVADAALFIAEWSGPKTGACVQY